MLAPIQDEACRPAPADSDAGASDGGRDGRSGALSIEHGLAGFVLAGLAWALWRLHVDGHLPQPFYYKVDDTLMDLHNAAYWARRADAYETWRALYPPLSFVFLRLVAPARCYVFGAAAARDCDHLSQLVLLAVFALNIVLVLLTYRLQAVRTATPRAIAISLGLPMLYALERGNLLIPCFTCFMLGYGDVLRSRWLRWLSLALSMNFKPYLGLIAMPLVVRRSWTWVAGCGLLTLGVYGATLLIQGSGAPLQIITNESRYAIAASQDRFADLYYATSYWPLIRAMETHTLGFAATPANAVVAEMLTLIVRVTQIASITCVLLALWRPGRTDLRRLSALIAGGAVTAYTSGSSGYAQMFVLSLVFFEPWKGFLRPVMLFAAYLLCAPVDLVLAPIESTRTFSFLGGREITALSGLSVGQFVRPALLLAIQICLIGLTLDDTLPLSMRGRWRAWGLWAARAAHVQDGETARS